ncbi:MAG: hypothetical protein K8S97_01670 [Anaerolineae bacterium]|nr:hypothetical protein [Anaerolineae bacterium]
MTRRDVVFSLLDDSATLPYIPAAFFLHFPPEFHAGQASVDKHLEFYAHTGMDLVKIQYERPFPKIPTIQTPDDWAQMPRYGLDYFAGQLAAVEGLVQAKKAEAVIVVTLYSPFMCAGSTATEAVLVQHLQAAPDKVKAGMEIITESMLLFVRECLKRGVDGFYHSTQGGETGRFDDPAIFAECIKPYDLALMNEANAGGEFNILHVCDYRLPYADFAPYVDYPGDIVNTPLHVGDRTLTPADITDLFGRPFMGGLERLGTLATGTPEQVRAEAEAVLRSAPERFILAADCTVPADTPWDNLKAAVDAAHNFRRA